MSSTMDPGSRTPSNSTTAGIIVHPNGHSHVKNLKVKIYEAPKPPMPLPKPIEYNVQDPIESFTGREDVLELLHKTIGDSKSADKVTVLSQMLVITGMGGIGKTQSTRNYILQHKGEYAHMLWISAEKHSLTKDCFEGIASLCNISSENFDSMRAVILDQIYDYVCSGDKPCLIVFDNAESMGTAQSEEGIKPFLPLAIKPGWQKPVILVTSRTPNWKDAGAGHVIQLTGLNEKECFKLLSDQLKFPDTPHNRDSAEKIRKMCEGLPLIVQQVIAIIRATNNDRESLGESTFTLLDFLGEVTEDRLEFANTLPADCPVGFPAFQIFKMAFERILEHENGGRAFRCLCVMSFLNPDNIPAKLLTALIAHVTKKRTALPGALNLLRNQNLITLHGGSFYTIHRVVQLVTISYMKTKSRIRRIGRIKSVLKNLGNAMRGTPGFWFTSADVLTFIIPPFLKLLETIPLNEDSLDKTFQNGLQIASRLKKHSEVEGTVIFLGALAEKLEAAGKYSEAENVWEDLLPIYASGKGTSEEKWYAESKLAWACLQQGKYDAALKIYKEVLETQESELGKDHEDTLETKGMMAVVYKEQGKYDDAIELNEYVLKNQEIKFGSNDSRTLLTKHNLAVALDASGKYERAIELYNDVRKYRELQLGPNHHLTLSTKHNLAGALLKMGKYDEAVKMFEDTLKGMESELGPNHVLTLGTKSSLASALEDKGEDERAFQLYEETLKAQMTHLGPDHIHTLNTKHNFACLHKKLGNYDTALEMFENVLKRREKVLGPNHPDTLGAKHNMACNLRKQGRYDEALRACEDILNSLKQDPDVIYKGTMGVKDEIARIYAHQGKYEDAVELFNEALEYYTESFGPDHSRTKKVAKGLRKALEGKANCTQRQCTNQEV